VRRSPTLVPVFALVFVLLATASVAARSPMALGIASESSTNLATIDAYRASTGAKPALWTLWSTWGDRGGRANCAKNVGTCAFPTALARGLRAKGVTPFIWWQPTDPANPSAGVYERYKNIITGKHNQYIRSWAKAAKAFGKPVIVRFAHEMNGDWFPWSLGNFDNNPRLFIKAWQHIVKQFRAVGARNVKFLWSPYLWGKGGYAKFYPGNAYVDYVGITSLNWGDTRWKPLTNLLERPMGALRKITRTRSSAQGKPVILPEVGSNHIGGDKAAWIRTGYKQVYKKWPIVRAMVYFDYNTTPVYQPDWRLIMPEDGSALAAYRSVASKRIFRASIP
jgi:hypothetical protein